MRAFSADHLAVAPDQRGYNLSSKPKGVHSYGIWPAVEDLRALVEHLGYDRFVLVGHDWGSLVAWSFALHYPEMLRALISLGGAHPAVLDRAQREDDEQVQASQYLLGLRRPDAIKAIAANDFAALEQALDHPFFTEEDREAYRTRGAFRGRSSRRCTGTRSRGSHRRLRTAPPAAATTTPDVAPLYVDVPTMVIYPEADPYVRPASHAGLEHFVRNLTFRPVQDGTHWIAEQHPELVNCYIREFLAAQGLAPE